MKIYVAHPYENKDENKKLVEEFIKSKLKEHKDITFVSPIHTFGFMYDELEYEEGMKKCLELLSDCDAIVMKSFEEIKHSKGCLIEYGYAKGKGISILSWYNFEKDLHDEKYMF